MQQATATVVGGRCLGHGQEEEQREMLMAQTSGLTQPDPFL